MVNVKEYDFVVYGATGFTGKLVVEYLVEKYSNDSEVTWALAGRNLEKLKSVADSIGVPENTELLVVDSNDVSSIETLVSKTKCVLTTVGPYQLYGDDIVAACAKSGTDYVDLCGELTTQINIVCSGFCTCSNNVVAIKLIWANSS